MSNILARFYKATGNEFFDTAIKLDAEVWNFVRFEFKNKSQKEMSKATGAKELPAGAIPYRYWESHGKPIHAAAWNVVKCVRQAYDIYPTDEAEVTEKRKWLQTAIGYCDYLCDTLMMTAVEIPSVNIRKLDNIMDLVEKEISLLKGVKSAVKVIKNRPAPRK